MDQMQYTPLIHHHFFQSLSNNPLNTQSEAQGTSEGDIQEEDNVEAIVMDNFYDTDED